LLEEERERKAAAATESSLTQLRNRIFDACVHRGSQAQGFFSHLPMVNVRQHRFCLLLGQRLIQPLLPNLDLYVLNDGLYHSDLGLVIENRPLEDFLL
jgi:hypothetical protein